MNEDEVKGKAEQAGGHVKESAGALVGDDKLKREGQADQASGGVKEAWGKVKDAAQSIGNDDK